MIKLLVDGVFFQVNNTGIARVWRSILELLVVKEELEIFFLDRGNAPKIDGINYIPFPKNLFAHSAADSQMIENICELYDIDAFTSTYYTTPLTTPMVLMVHDMIPELFDFDLSQRAWMEKDIAISYAQRYLCNSYSTQDDLLVFYPEIPHIKTVVAHCGVDESVLYKRDIDEIESFKDSYGLEKPYFLFVGSRVQHKGYKNSELFFDAVNLMKDSEFDVFCVGGEKEIEEEILDSLPSGVQCKRVELTDDELALAYGGAIALVYPSLYEGFGMPVIEAMSCGCPVITTQHGSLSEAAGNAACLISGFSVDEMRLALERVQEMAYRESLIESGFEHVKHFRWTGMAEALYEQLLAVVKEAKQGSYDSFFYEWKRIRKIQESVDYVI